MPALIVLLHDGVLLSNLTLLSRVSFCFPRSFPFCLLACNSLRILWGELRPSSNYQLSLRSLHLIAVPSRSSGFGANESQPPAFILSDFSSLTP